MYIRTEYSAGNVREITKSHRFPCQIVDGKIRRSRKAKEKPTREAMQKYNEKQRQRKAARKANANFGRGDLYLTLTYQPDRRPDEDGAERIMRNFRAALRKRFRKAGREMKWMCTTEIGARGAIHHHMILSRWDANEVAELWQRYGGNAHIQIIYSADLTKLGEYIAKQNRSGRKTYSCSRNLIDPAPIRKRVKADSWRETPSVPDGWTLVPESYEIGINPVTGYGYQYYRIVRRI